jgi:hypothetical protein
LFCSNICYKKVWAMNCPDCEKDTKVQLHIAWITRVFWGIPLKK